jgi:hypothetical protein
MRFVKALILLIVLIMYPLSVTFAYQYFYSTSPKTLSAGLVITYEHYIAVTNITSKTVVGQGLTFNITLPITNQGLQLEAFNVTLMADSSVITSWENMTLQNDANEIISFTCNTTSFAFGNYTLSSFIEPVPGETNSASNNCTGGWFIVSKIGDMTGPNGYPDGKVDMRDVALVARAFGSTIGSSNWNPNCDINNDGVVNMKDVALVARHFGT